MPNFDHLGGRSLGRFLANTAGNVATIFALSALPMIFAAGSAIDYVRKVRAQTHLQAAMDGAALAIATSGATTDAAKKKVGESFLQANFADTELEGVVPAITINGSVITVSADYNIPTQFMSLAGIDVMPIHSVSRVEGGSNSSAEVAMVLDYSLSMTNSNKYTRMRDAAEKMIDQLAASKPADATLKMGLVPFSAMVRTTMPAAYVSQSSSGTTWTGCTQDRQYPWNIGVATPDGSAASKWGYIESGNENKKPKDCAGYQANGLDIVPLTEDLGTFKGKIDKMVPIGNTNIPLGVEFGWNLLDPAAPFTEGAPYTDLNNKKFMVLLTDGVQTSKEYGSDGSRSVDYGNQNLVTLCGSMRTKKITIFAIAYDVTDSKVTDLLKQCAPGTYYEASTSGSEIDQVFDAIAIRIKKSTLRIAR
jgi:Flp pilus assembly protein TadG